MPKSGNMTPPPFRRFGTRSIYRWGDVIDWAEDRMVSRRDVGQVAGEMAGAA
jgi:hypothetical protein